MSKKLIITFGLMVLLQGIVMAQNLPNVTLSTPNAASLFKYVEYPVDYSTGIPEISIPLYEVKSGMLSLPITLNYHSSGRKVYDETGAVGLGWTLIAGGMISRTVYGDPDDYTGTYPRPFPSPWKKQSDINEKNDIDFLAGIDNDNTLSIPWYDSEYDIFSYFINGLSGKFVLRDSNNIKIPVLLQKKPFTVVQDQGFTLTDDKGTIYQFRDIETSYTEEVSPIVSATTGWQITRIISPDRADTINFKYQSFSKQRITVSENTIVKDTWTSNPMPIPDVVSTSNSPGGSYSHEDYTIQRLSEIDFRNGKIIFNLQPGSDVIQNMQVIDRNNSVIKTIAFNLSNLDNRSDGNASTSKLTSLNIKGMNEDVIQQYSFDYYPTIYANNFNNVNARFCDYWGYYNASGNENMLPAATIPVMSSSAGSGTINIGGSQRLPSLSATESGVLKNITYPTGGTTEYDYEMNQYFDNKTQTAKECGGLRVYQIKTDDKNGHIIYKTYKYGINECGYGILPLVPDAIENMSTSNNMIDYTSGAGGATLVGDSYRQRIFSSNVNPIFTYIASKPVIYTNVTEYQGIPGTSPLGPINIGKTIYEYDYPDLIAPTSMSSYFQYYNYNYWKTSSLIKKTNYKYDNINNIYTPVNSVINNYTETEFDTEKIWGLNVHREYITTPSLVLDLAAPNGTGQYIPSYKFLALRVVCSPTLGCQGGAIVFSYGDYTLSIGKKELSSTQNINYTDAGQLTSTTGYEYTSNDLISKTSFTNSNGDIITTDLKYPFDFLSDPFLGDVSSKMVDANMLNYPIEQIIEKNTVFLKSVKTIYKDWSTNSIPQMAQQNVQTKQGSNPYETRITFYSYDSKSNPLSFSKENDVIISYIWGYNNTYPVAEVKGISYSSAIALLNQSIIQNPLSDQALRNELDKIRQTFPLAFVTTFTYKPLVGVTSETDPNGRTTYYEYDPFNRLSIIRDKDQNIVKKICYDYAGQPGQCSLYESDAINADYYSQNCSSSESAVAYHVSVPQGMFTSSVDQPTANQLAQQYAQNQANQYGTCQVNNISVYGDDEVGSDFSVTLHNTSTGQDYSFNLYAHNESTLDDVPPGDYDISLTPLSSAGYYSYSVGCGYYDEGPGGSTITFYAVPLSASCNVITIN